MHKRVLHKNVGPLLWVLSLQYFVVQVVVMMHYKTSFSVRNNTISDLGNTVCSTYNNRAVCSPWHLLMNTSFVILGLTMFFGSLYIYKLVAQTSKNKYGMGAMALAGIGTILVRPIEENCLLYIQ